MKMHTQLMIASLLMAASSLTGADIAVIVHPIYTGGVSAEEATRIFLGKSKTFASGAEAIPVLVKSGGSREQLLGRILDKSESQLRAMWARQIFTGQGNPPREVSSDEEVRKLVASNPALIGVVDAAAADGSVRVVLKK